MSRRTIFVLIIAAVAVGLASVFIIFPNLFKSAVNLATTEYILFSNLFKLAADRTASMLASLPDLFNSTVDLAAAPVLKLLSPFGIDLPKEVAAGLTVGFTALIAILVKRSSFTKIAFRNIPRRKLRNGLTVLAIILGVALVVGVNIAFDSAFIQFKRTLNQATGNVDITIRSGLDVPFDQSLLTTIKKVEGVADASARVSGQVVLLESNSSWKVATVIGVDSSSDFDYLDPDSTRITRKLQFVTTKVKLKVNSTNAIVDEGLNYTIGDFIRVYVITHFNGTNQPNEAEPINQTMLNIHYFTVVGILHPSQVSEQAGFGPFRERMIYIDLVKAQEILNCPGKVSTIIVKVADVKRTEQVVDDLRHTLGTTYMIAPMKKSIISKMEGGISGFQFGLQILSVMGLCVAILIILNTIYMSVSERTYEIGILRSIGTFRRQIFWTFFSESLILGVIGVAIGLVAGVMMAKTYLYVVSFVFSPLTGGTFTTTTFEPGPGHFIMGAIAGLVATVLAGVFPSLMACRQDIVKALRPAMRKGGKPRTALKLVIIGLPLTIIGALTYMWFTYLEQRFGIILVYALVPITMAGLFLLVSGLLRTACPAVEHLLNLISKATGKIISRNIGRNLLRSTICFSLIGMSLSFVIVMGGAQVSVMTGVEDMIRSFYPVDLTISSQMMLPRSFADDLTGIDNGTLISYATPVCIVPYRTMLGNSERNSTSTVWSIDPATYSKVMSMTLSDDTPANVITKLEASGTIILASPLAQSFNARVGDELTMYAVNYTDTTQISMNFTVIGILEGGAHLEMMRMEGSPLSEACYISHESLDESFPAYTDRSNLFFAKAKSGQDVGHIKDRIMELYGDEYLLGIITTSDILKLAKTEADRIFLIFYAIIMLAVVNAAVGIATIMVMNVAERRREIGIMRSQGMNNFQVVVSIVGEVIILGVVGFFVATVGGLIFLRTAIIWMQKAPVYMSQTGVGFPVPYIIPFDAIGLSLVLAVISTIISAVYPAYRASKLNIVDALRR